MLLARLQSRAFFSKILGVENLANLGARAPSASYGRNQGRPGAGNGKWAAQLFTQIRYSDRIAGLPANRLKGTFIMMLIEQRF